MDRTRYIIAGTFIDGSGKELQRNVFLEVKDGIITSIGPAKNLKRNGESAIDDLSQSTIVPALVDCSVSLARSPSVDEKVRLAAEESGPAEKEALIMQHIDYCHAHGVLGVAESNDSFGLGEHGPVLKEQETIIDIRTAGADFIRIDYSGNIGNTEASDSRLDQEELYRILQQRGEKKTVVVANGEQQVQEALEAGCDGIELGYGMGEDNLRQMADKNVLWIPGVLTAQTGLQGSASGGDVMCRFSMRYVAAGKGDPGAEAFWKKMLADQLEQLRLARELGVETAVGTGAGNVGILHGESVTEEIKLFIKAGYSLAEAIQCGSDNGARFFNMEHLGALAVGRPATFLAVKGTVLQLPRKLAYLEGVYVNGEPSKKTFKL
jgi:imidazolonepropionase-like amidohydrolase